MRISADVSSIVSSERTVIVEHDDGSHRQPITFGLALYKRDHFSDDVETFRVINDYWAHLPEEEQAAIYSIYEDVRELFDSTASIEAMTIELTRLVTALMEYHKTDRVIEWIKTHSGLQVPSGVSRQYQYNVDKNTTKDKTYVYEDYIGLMSLPVIFRAMIPIWAMYNKPMKDSVGGPRKERQAFLLLKDSCIYHSEPMERLRRYVVANVDPKSYTTNHTLEHICSEDHAEYLLSIVCVTRLCLGELPVGRDPVRNLAALVYVAVVDRPPPQGNDYSQKVQDKKIPTEGGGESNENSGSTLELYKARATITPGIIAALEYPTRDILSLAYRSLPGFNKRDIKKDVDRALETSQSMLETGVQIPQRLLAQWFCSNVYPPMGMMYLDDHFLVSMCALSEVITKHLGFPYLSLLSTATPMLNDLGLRMTPVAAKSQIDEELNAKISEVFPYKRHSLKSKSANSHICFVSEDIKTQVAELSKYTWRATADEELVKSVLGTHVRRIPMLPQLRTDLFNALIVAEELHSAPN